MTPPASENLSRTGFPVWFVNAFADGFYTGNTAAVVLLQEYPPDADLLALAREFGFSETAFLKRLNAGEYRIRWFTPEVEVPLCGHATLASARCLFDNEAANLAEISLHSLSGDLRARRKKDLIELDFPADIPEQHAADDEVLLALGNPRVGETLLAPRTKNLIAVYPSAADVLALRPDFARLSGRTDLPYFGIAATALGTDQDYVCRYFAPWEGIDEDPVTGSAQTFLGPYWSRRLKKPILSGYQASARGGYFEVEMSLPRVLIRGQAFVYLRGELIPGWQV